ncbi:hypothetical protein LUZ60_004398 [Juncus effusus]|nr:hypothetical protein LUZ60_004398 [Juncus effusus]
MAGGSNENTTSSEIVTELGLEYTPTWIVAGVCCFIVLISLVFERLLHRAGKILKKRNQKPLFEALQKVKEELMLLGFISLLLTVFRGRLQKICVPKTIMHKFIPCVKNDPITTQKLATDFFPGAFSGGRRLLAAGGVGPPPCTGKHVSLLSAEAVDQLHIFIFILAVTHVVLSAITVILGITQMRKLKRWENDLQQMIQSGDGSHSTMSIMHIEQFQFIKDRFKGFGKAGGLYGWIYAFFKQFYGSITEEDYSTMRLGFINKHCRGNPMFNFYRYMIRALEADFKKVVGISWYLWFFVIIFLLLNVEGWHAYFYISLCPLIILVIVGAKLEHIITELAHEVAEKHTAVEGDLLINPSDRLFWFGRPKIILFLVHFILFQNAFEISHFLWILTSYSYNSCINGRKAYIIPRLVVSGVTQFLCGYCTLPLYAIVSHMGSSFKRAIFDDHIHAGLLGWAQDARNHRKGKVATTGEEGSSGTGDVQLENMQRESDVTPLTRH